jgi:hypothetical protein
MDRSWQVHASVIFFVFFPFFLKKSVDLFIRIGDDVYRVRKQRRSSNDLYSLPVR